MLSELFWVCASDLYMQNFSHAVRVQNWVLSHLLGCEYLNWQGVKTCANYKLSGRCSTDPTGQVTSPSSVPSIFPPGRPYCWALLLFMWRQSWILSSHFVFRNHSNMLIWWSGNISITTVFESWKPWLFFHDSLNRKFNVCVCVLAFKVLLCAFLKSHSFELLGKERPGHSSKFSFV